MVSFRRMFRSAPVATATKPPAAAEATKPSPLRFSQTPQTKRSSDSDKNKKASNDDNSMSEEEAVTEEPATIPQPATTSKAGGIWGSLRRRNRQAVAKQGNKELSSSAPSPKQATAVPVGNHAATGKGNATRKRNENGKRKNARNDQWPSTTSDDESDDYDEEEEQEEDEMDAERQLEDEDRGTEDDEDEAMRKKKGGVGQATMRRLRRISRTFDGMVGAGSNRVKRNKKKLVQSDGSLDGSARDRPVTSRRDSMKKSMSTPSKIKDNKARTVTGGTAATVVPMLKRSSTFDNFDRNRSQTSRPTDWQSKSRLLLEQSIRDNQSYGSRVLMIGRAKDSLRPLPDYEDEDDEDGAATQEVLYDVTNRFDVGGGVKRGLAMTARDETRYRRDRSGSVGGGGPGGAAAAAAAMIHHAHHTHHMHYQHSNAPAKKQDVRRLSGKMRTLRLYRRRTLAEHDDDFRGLSQEDVKSLKVLKDILREAKACIETLEEEEEEYERPLSPSTSGINSGSLNSPSGGAQPGGSVLRFFSPLQLNYYANLPSPRATTVSPFFPSLIHRTPSFDRTPARRDSGGSELPPLSLELPNSPKKKRRNSSATPPVPPAGISSGSGSNSKKGGKLKRDKKAAKRLKKAQKKRMKEEQHQQQQMQENKENGDSRLNRLLTPSKESLALPLGAGLIRSRSQEDMSNVISPVAPKTAVSRGIAKPESTKQQGANTSRVEYKLEFVKDKKSGVWKKKKIKVKKGEGV